MNKKKRWSGAKGWAILKMRPCVSSKLKIFPNPGPEQLKKKGDWAVKQVFRREWGILLHSRYDLCQFVPSLSVRWLSQWLDIKLILI
ncbi:MAG: hypothetical protein CSA33_08760 [Desulfobulbus propionicus]|nr:MAG: hypothetical protein CSA33_08760 [Desulfobulbus propionicus]